MCILEPSLCVIAPIFIHRHLNIGVLCRLTSASAYAATVIFVCCFTGTPPTRLLHTMKPVETFTGPYYIIFFNALCKQSSLTGLTTNPLAPAKIDSVTISSSLLPVTIIILASLLICLILFNA